MRKLLILVVSLVCFTAIAECRVPEFKPDLYTPVQTLKVLLEEAKDFNLFLFIQTLLQILGNCIPATNELNLEQLASSLTPIIQEDPLTNFTEVLIYYMKTPAFADIHYHLWNDTEWNDIIELFYTAGWNGDNSVYKGFQTLYDHLECDLSIPTGPRASIPSRNQFSSRSDLNQQKYETLAIFPLAGCNLLEIFLKLLQSHFIEMSNLIRFVWDEVNTDASVHLLWAKIYEPAKGIFFRETRSRQSVKDLIMAWDQALKNNDLFEIIIGVLEQLTGINFSELDINVFGNLVSIVEFMIWRTPFPVWEGRPSTLLPTTTMPTSLEF